jgi:hypothetical protein
MKMDDYKLPELRTIAKYLEIEGWNKMKRADLEAQIFFLYIINNTRKRCYLFVAGLPRGRPYLSMWLRRPPIRAPALKPTSFMGV